MEQRILDKARELFFQHGIKSITMDAYTAYEFNISDILHQLTEVYMYGIATDKGRELINKQLKQHI